MYKHVETDTIFQNFDQLRIWLVQNKNFAVVEATLPQVMVEFGIEEYTPTAHIPSPDEVKQQLIQSVQGKLDSTAQAKGYDNILSACSYDNDPNPVFAADSIAFKAWRSAVWTYCYQVLDDVQQMKRSVPTVEELISELPEL